MSLVYTQERLPEALSMRQGVGEAQAQLGHSRQKRPSDKPQKALAALKSETQAGVLMCIPAETD